MVYTMSLILFDGNLFDSTAPAIGQGVNVYGVMGAGIAVEFKRRYPEMYEAYKEHCVTKRLVPGKTFFWDEEGKPAVYNMASQDAPGANATLGWLDDSLRRSLAHAAANGYDRIGLPRIGCGIGGLAWEDVEPLYEAASAEHGVDIEVWTYAP